MKILFITDNFPPEVNAPATRTYEHCADWVKQGAEVTVITCFPNFPQGKVYAGFRNKPWQVTHIENIRVIRVWSYITANEGFLKRSLDYISFGITAFIAALFLRCDIIVATSPQFFAAMAAHAAAFLKRKPWIMEVRDLWPESIKSVGAMKQGRMLNFLERLELRMYRSASAIVVVTESFKINLAGRGIPPGKISIIKNGVNFALFQPREKDAELLRSLELQNKFVLGYIGTHGMAHGLDFILECAAKLQHAGPFHFLFIGNGAEKTRLLQIKAARQLDNVSFLDSVEKSAIPRYLSVMDIALVPLRRSDTFKKVIPSKIFETAAMRIPVFLGVEGEARELIERYDAGFCFEPENAESFIANLSDYYAGRRELKLRYQAGCTRLAADFDRKRLAGEMLAIIENTLNNQR